MNKDCAGHNSSSSEELVEEDGGWSCDVAIDVTLVFIFFLLFFTN